MLFSNQHSGVNRRVSTFHQKVVAGEVSKTKVQDHERCCEKKI